MISVAILYVCTGKYNQFFKGFYESSERNFMPNEAQKHYYVFTDDMSLTKANNVTLIEKKCEGFPMDSLMRFKMFLSIKDEILKHDYVYFFNSNMLFLEIVNQEVLPENEGEMVFTLNAGYKDKTAFRYPYERNKNSKAYIPFDMKNDYKYVIGGLNGGKSKDYIRFSEICHNNINEDTKNGILAIYHDESHINRYFFDNGGKLLHPKYAFPEGANFPYEPLILIRDKTKVDMYFNKGRDFSLKSKINKAFNILLRGLIWVIN